MTTEVQEKGISRSTKRAYVLNICFTSIHPPKPHPHREVLQLVVLTRRPSTASRRAYTACLWRKCSIVCKYKHNNVTSCKPFFQILATEVNVTLYRTWSRLPVVLHVPLCTVTIFKRGSNNLTLLRFLAKLFPQLWSCSGNQVMNDTVTFIHNAIIHNAKLWHFAIHNCLKRPQLWMTKVTIQCYFDSNQCHQWSSGYYANPDSERPGFDPSFFSDC